MIFYFVYFPFVLDNLPSYAHPLHHLYPDRKVPTTKDLEKPWVALKPRRLLPASSTTRVAPKPSSPKWTGHSAATTILLDDSHAKAALQPHNHLCVPEYTRSQRNMDLGALTLERAQRQQQHYSVPYQEQEDPATTNTISPTLTLTSRAQDGTTTATTTEIVHNKKRKRKRDKTQQQLQSQLAMIPTSSADGDAASPAAFDETLLAVIGILHAARLQSSIAGWLRAGALLSLPSSSSAERDGGGPGDGKTWYDDPVLVRAWASRGREAMRELGLKVEHGVEA